MVNGQSTRVIECFQGVTRIVTLPCLLCRRCGQHRFQVSLDKVVSLKRVEPLIPKQDKPVHHRDERKAVYLATDKNTGAGKSDLHSKPPERQTAFLPTQAPPG